jgi:hypothetical protein
MVGEGAPLAPCTHQQPGGIPTAQVHLTWVQCLITCRDLLCWDQLQCSWPEMQCCYAKSRHMSFMGLELSSPPPWWQQQQQQCHAAA